jgi:hypothetical protein
VSRGINPVVFRGDWSLMFERVCEFNLMLMKWKLLVYQRKNAIVSSHTGASTTGSKRVSEREFYKIFRIGRFDA